MYISSPLTEGLNPLTVYRVQATHVDYWRGSPHRWHSTLHYSCSSDSSMAATIPDAYTKLNALGSQNNPGGLAEIAVYNTATKGVPIASTVYFDWTTPASWLPYNGTCWPSGTFKIPVSGESAAHLRTQAGYSKTGKPVFVGLFWHAFVADATDSASPSFNATTVGKVATAYNALQTLSAGGSAVAVQVTPSGNSIAGSGTLVPYVVSHQRRRGRRKSTPALLAELKRRGGSVPDGYTGPTIVIPD